MDPLIAIRLVHYGAAMLLAGGGVFRQALAPAALRARLAAPRAERWLALLVLISALLWFAGETANIGNGWGDAVSPQALAAVVTETPFGQVWIWRLVFTVVLVVLYLASGRLGRWPRVTLAAVLLASLALVGHGAMDDGPLGLLHRGSDMVHLLAAGFWLGALPPLSRSLRLARDPALRELALVALRRFSGLGHLAVIATLITGVANALLILTHGRLTGSAYWLMLGAKIVLVLIMTSVAVINRYWLMRRLSSGSEVVLATLRRNTIAEMVLGAGVVALVSALGTLDPG